MIALAGVLYVCAWLWWSGLEVPEQPAFAALAWGAGSALLFAAYLRAGRRLPAGRRAGRAAAWAVTTAILAPLLAWATSPLVDWGGPFLAGRVFPSGPLAALARAWGIDAHALPGLLVVQDLAEVPAHATSWHQIGTPATVVLLAMFWLATTCRAGDRRRAATIALVALLGWLPIRFLLITRLVEDLGWLGFHWHPLAVGASLLPGAFVAERLRPLRSLRRHPLARWHAWLLPRSALLAAGAALLVFALLWVPSTGRSPGRVLLDDAHSDWEWTAIPFDRESYGRQSTYSYTCLLDYLRHHYSADANPDRDLTDELLDRYDVLILKTPTRPYLESERDAVVRFVRRGGGLLLVGDHTNLFGMTTYMNGLADPFGIEFDTDDTFELTTGAPSRFAPPALGAHPAVAHLPGLEFETSCTVKASPWLRPVIAARGLGSEQVDYGHVNFFGDIQPDPHERWGVFLQAAARRFGRGRVLAFTDSTVFSNFSVFFRGKPELALGMVEYLNRSAGLLRPVPMLLMAGGATVILLALSRRARPGRNLGKRRSRASGSAAAPIGFAALVIGAALGGALATSVNAAAQPLPPPHHPLTVVAFERRHSSYRLATLLEGVVSDPDRAFDAFFVATQRLHLFPRVAEDTRDALRGASVVVVLNPASAPGSGEIDALYAWVRQGGSLLIMERLAGSHPAANAFLAPADMRISAAFPGQTEVPSVSGLAIYGGQPARLGPEASTAADGPLASFATLGRGRVIALLGSERFSFQSMGPAFNDPSAEQRVAYERAYRLFEEIVLPEGWEKECPLPGAARVADGGRSAIIAPRREGSSR